MGSETLWTGQAQHGKTPTGASVMMAEGVARAGRGWGVQAELVAGVGSLGPASSPLLLPTSEYWDLLPSSIYFRI